MELLRILLALFADSVEEAGCVEEIVGSAEGFGAVDMIFDFGSCSTGFAFFVRFKKKWREKKIQGNENWFLLNDDWIIRSDSNQNNLNISKII